MFLSYIHTFLKALDLDLSLLEIPQDRSMGDFAYPCFLLAKEFKKSPVMIAKDIESISMELLGDHKYIDRVLATGPYINIFLNTNVLSTDVLESTHMFGNKFGRGQKTKRKVLIESPGPNTNKPLHLGHVRNMLLGNSLALLGTASGADVTKVDIVNDRGIHICKSMLAYQKFGNNAEPNKKSDHYVGDRYVRYDQELKLEIKNLTNSIHNGDFSFFGDNGTLVDEINDIIRNLIDLYKYKEQSINSINFKSIIFNSDIDKVLEGAMDGNYEFREFRERFYIRTNYINHEFLAELNFVGESLTPIIRTENSIEENKKKLFDIVKKNSLLHKDINNMLEKREAGDPEVRVLWLKMRDWCFDGLHETYEKYDCHIEKSYFESDHYLKGKDIVEKGLKSGLFVRKEGGNVVFDDPKLGEKVVLRSNGTSIYITQDLALGKVRYDDRKMDEMIYVVGNEQQDHFKFLFKIFEKMGESYASGCFHMSYGMIELPDGKMKSREGNVVDADALLDDMIEQSKKIILERHASIPQEELNKRSHQIALGAIKFFILKYDAKKNFVFDRNESLRFDGESGPYVQYTAVRCSSILANSQYDTDDYDATLLSTDLERQILLHISEFGLTIKHATSKYQPYLIARYVLDLSQLFNSYYQKTKILDDNERLSRSRLALVRAVRQVLKNGLDLLGIEIPERM